MRACVAPSLSSPPPAGVVAIARCQPRFSAALPLAAERAAPAGLYLSKQEHCGETYTVTEPSLSTDYVSRTVAYPGPGSGLLPIAGGGRRNPLCSNKPARGPGWARRGATILSLLIPWPACVPYYPMTLAPSDTLPTRHCHETVATAAPGDTERVVTGLVPALAAWPKCAGVACGRQEASVSGPHIFFGVKCWFACCAWPPLPLPRGGAIAGAGGL